MCYFICGAVNKEANRNDMNALLHGCEFAFSTGTKHDLIEAAGSADPSFRITKCACDCDSAVGNGDASAGQVLRLAETIRKLRSARNIKYVLLIKAWYLDRVKSEKTVHIDDIDLARLLANAEECCLYRIDLCQRSFDKGANYV